MWGPMPDTKTLSDHCLSDHFGEKPKTKDFVMPTGAIWKARQAMMHVAVPRK